MPILDIHGTPLVHHTVLTSEIRNIEFCGGTGFFGKKEFPLCYSTDIEIPKLKHFSLYPDDYETQDCHFLDERCDFFNPPFHGRTFDNIIICNPYNLGFSGRFETKRFLVNINELLNDDGKLFLIGNSKNPWSRFRNLSKNYKYLVDDAEVEDVFEFILEELNSDHYYRINYTFYVTGFGQQTIPDQLITIRKKVA